MAKRKNTFIHKPVYPGGKAALQAFIKEHLRYPKAALKNKTEGIVRVEYSLNQQGKVIKAMAVKGPKDGCRQEAERVVKLLRFNVPKDYKMSVRYHQHLNINFKVPTKAKPKSTKLKKAGPAQITYTITTARQTEKVTEQQPAKKGYSYTIRWN